MSQMFFLIKRYKKAENGIAAVLFAISLMVLLGFVSLAVDVGMINMKRAHMMDLCQQMRRARLAAGDFIMSADDPARLIYEITNDCAIDNGFTGGLKVYYAEESVPVYPTSEWVERRTSRVRIELTQEMRFTMAAAVFSHPNKEIKIYLDGGEMKSDPYGTAPVWYPYEKLKTGSYERQDNTGVKEPDFKEGDLPAGW